MSGGTFKYDLEELTTVQEGLRTLASDFESASSTRKDADSALGYGDLRSAVRDFVDNWSHERDQQIEAINGSAEALTEIIDNYVEYDETSADQLREDCAPA